MSFISGALDKSLFNKESYVAAVGKKYRNGYSVVRITPNVARTGKSQIDIPIKGVYNNDSGGLQISIGAEWKELGHIATSVLSNFGSNVAGFYEKVNDIISVGGLANMGAAWASQKVYQKSGRLEIKVPMIIVDWQGTGQPLESAKLLATYVIPEESGTVGDELDKAINTLLINPLTSSNIEAVSAFGNAIKSSYEGLEKGAKEVYKTLNTAADTAMKSESTLMAAAGKGMKTLLDVEDAATLRSSPSPVILEIGQFFRHTDMVIDNVSFEFSKEMTRAGPLYVKVDLQLSSRKIITSLKDIGFIDIEESQSRSKYISSDALAKNLTGY